MDSRKIKTVIHKAIRFERDCKSITKDNYTIVFPSFAQHFFKVWGDDMGGHLLAKIQYEKDFDAISFIWDLDENNLTKFINNY